MSRRHVAAEQSSVGSDHIADVALRSFNKRAYWPVNQQVPRKVPVVGNSLERGVADVADHHVGLMLPMKELNVEVDMVWQAVAWNEATLVALGDWQKWEPVFPRDVHNEQMSFPSLHPYSKTALVADHLLLLDESSEGCRLFSICR